MLDVMDNGTQVLYTWQTIDFEEYEQFWPKEQDPIFDINEDCEVVSAQGRFMGLIQPLKPNKWWSKLLDLNPLVNFFVKSLVLKECQVEYVNKNGPTPI
jgi:hypothetical protein